ncbi:sigma-54-dependent Fis family transcriptional regulator [Clostridium sp. DJ247]|uniref:sigma-54-dependent Fis family transcriptional regulator n=1 Tax=Clostridium sp. DJ247 TaxID=2726188 RepID=UPI0016260936|nr:sigma-54-dependent Fis family transcriptional regulator [Clostridium sp. DJ247]MBC2581621.1 sigma-54-dependent Fis family transcriptional regulator [Clostridium sp. DJ247]
MKNYTEVISNDWKVFIEKGYISNRVRPEIAESWKRCRAYGIDHMNGRGNNATLVDAEVKIKENTDLIISARPVMESIYSIVAGSGFAIILSDKDGYIVDIIGDSDIMQRAEELNFIKGALWTEESVGTNAIGTALYLNKPIQTIGAEHFGINQHSWTCSAAPIHDEDGNICGCINMSGNYYNAHSHTLGIVTAAAQSIQKQLELTISYNLMNVTFDSICEGMIVLDSKLKIRRVNDRASDILNITHEEAMNINIVDTLKSVNFYEIISQAHKTYHNMDCDFYIKNKRIKCIMNAVSMMVSGKLVGIVITFREVQYAHRIVNKIIGYKASYRFEDIITENKEMKRVIDFAKKISENDCNILIEGESGTGKELMAQSIHNYSNRLTGPFVAVNCASIPRELVESELFGYERGAFTGASKEGHPGKFELADGGTIFLDEIGELPLDIQSKFLRILDNNKIIRVGGSYEKQLNVRVICATNRNLKDEISKKNFRSDLYYRLNVMHIKTIPLRQRKEDIEGLTKYFIERLNAKNHHNVKKINRSYINILKKYDWPGNVRELRNIVERDYYLNEEILTHIGGGDEALSKSNYEKDNRYNVIPIQIIERKTIEDALKKCDGNILKAAKLLNISRATIYRKMKKYNIKNQENKVYKNES